MIITYNRENYCQNHCSYHDGMQKKSHAIKSEHAQAAMAGHRVKAAAIFQGHTQPVDLPFISMISLVKDVDKQIMDEPREPDPKRAKLQLQLKNGHDCIFKEELPKHLQIECSICLCVLDDPHMIDCKCGASFCQPCIQPTLTEKKPCPLCNTTFTSSFPDRRLQRTLNSLQIYCSFKEAGCEWMGELGALSEHLNVNIKSASYKSSGCPFLQLKCYHCKEDFQRQYVLGHEKNKCLKRPYKCDHCDEFESTFEDVTTNHVNVCPCGLVPCPNNCGTSLQRKDVDDHLATKCPLEIVTCSFSYAGCEEKFPRKDMPAHINDSLAVHMSLQAKSHQKELKTLRDKVQNLEKELQRVKSKGEKDITRMRTHLGILPIELVMDGFAANKREGKCWYSEPFYTCPRGYKMSMAVKNEASHLSVFIYVMRGEFDAELEWPYRGTILIQLLNRDNTKKNFIQLLSFNNAPEASVKRVKEGDRSGTGWGYAQFIANTELTKYIKNDSLYFKVSCSTVLTEKIVVTSQ